MPRGAGCACARLEGSRGSPAGCRPGPRTGGRPGARTGATRRLPSSLGRGAPLHTAGSSGQFAPRPLPSHLVGFGRRGARVPPSPCARQELSWLRVTASCPGPSAPGTPGTPPLERLPGYTHSPAPGPRAARRLLVWLDAQALALPVSVGAPPRPVSPVPRAHMTPGMSPDSHVGGDSSWDLWPRSPSPESPPGLAAMGTGGQAARWTSATGLGLGLWDQALPEDEVRRLPAPP